MKKILFALFGFAALLAGCSTEDSGTPPPPPMSSAQVEANVQKIQSDPNMPEAQKQMAINGMKAGAAMAAQHAAAAAQSRKSPVTP